MLFNINTETTLYSRFLRPVAGAALAVMLSIGLGGCGGGGGSGGGAQVTIVPDQQTPEQYPQTPEPDQQTPEPDQQTPEPGSQTPAQESPDLLVESPSVSDPAPAAGAIITISTMVRNAGSAAAPAAKVRFYRSADAAITTSDEEVGASSSAELAVSGVGAASVELTAPQAPGTYYYGACAAAVSGESDAANNCSASARVTVPGSAAPSAQPQPPVQEQEDPQPPAQPQPQQEDQQQEPPLLVREVPKQALPRPDLVAGSPSSSDANPLPGADFTFSATVRNAGDGAAAATTVRFYRSSDAAITASDAQAGSTAVAGLAPSGSAVASAGLTAPQSPGTYYYGACVAAVSGESDTANNCSASVRVVVPGPPDLVVKSPAASDANPLAGAGFTLSATVRNAGGRAAAATTARFYRSDDAAITASDTQVGSTAVAGLAGSGSVVTSKALTAPASLGTYYYGICVDAVAGESDTGNNCSASVRVTVPGPPDLVSLPPWVSDTSPIAGTIFRVKGTVRNDGGKRSGGSRLIFYRSTDETISRSDTLQGGHLVGFRGVSPSRTWQLGMPLRAPWTHGTYYYGACVDAVRDESDTANNCSAGVKVTVREAPAADVVLGSLSASPASPAAGGVFRLDVTVRNAGGRGVGGVKVRFYRSDDATITTSDTELTAGPGRNLPAWGSIGSSAYSLDTPPVGTYHYGACADVVAGESDTTNNCSTALKVEVTHARPNLRFFTSSRLGWRGGKFGLAVGLKNGGGPSPATTLRFYHSTDRKITTSDTELASVAVPALVKTESGRAPRFYSKVVWLPGPTTDGWHHYGACVDPVPDESDTTDNCIRVHRIIRE